LNDHPIFEKLRQATLTPQQQESLLGLIADTFKRAIDARSPKNRPPGKAGLRAEKGYYRLLYLEGVLQDKVCSHSEAEPDVPLYCWDPVIDLVRQLADIPELRSEILAGVETALDETMSERLTTESP